jgi:hypothetical protein
VTDVAADLIGLTVEAIQAFDGDLVIRADFVHDVLE